MLKIGGRDGLEIWSLECMCLRQDGLFSGGNEHAGVASAAAEGEHVDLVSTVHGVTSAEGERDFGGGGIGADRVHEEHGDRDGEPGGDAGADVGHPVQHDRPPGAGV